MVAEDAAREDRDVVLLVVDVRDGDGRRLAVDIVRERLVADAWEAEPDDARRDVGDMERKVDRVQESDGRAWKEAARGRNEYKGKYKDGVKGVPRE